MKLRTPLIALLITTISVLALPMLASATPPGGPDDMPPPEEMDGPPPAGHPMGGPGMGGRRGAGGPPHFTKAQRKQFRQRMKRRFAKLLRNKLQLPEATAKKVEALMRDSMKQRRPLHQQLRGYHQTLRKLLKEDSNDQAAFRDALAGVHRSREGLRKLQEQQVRGLQRLLTPKQQAQLLQAHHRMRRHMRQMRRGRRGQRGMRRGGGQGGQRGQMRRGGPQGAEG